MTESASRTYTVSGMSCEHCRSSVLEEVAEIEGVDVVEVDLESGRLIVTGAEVDEASIRTAVEEAGYELAKATV